MQILDVPSDQDVTAVPSGTRSGQPSPARAICWYVLACLASFVVSWFALNRVQARQLQTIRNSTLIYAGQDLQAKALAEWTRTHLQIQTVDLLSPGASATVRHLTGARYVVSPTLVMPSNHSTEVVSGLPAVNQALEPITNQINPVQRAKLALATMVLLIGIAWFLASEVTMVASLLPIPGLIAVSALWGHCLHCGTSGSTLSALAPLLELVYLGMAIPLFTVPLLRNRLLYAGFLILSGAIPAIQAYMLVGEPKFCPACLTITVVAQIGLRG